MGTIFMDVQSSLDKQITKIEPVNNDLISILNGYMVITLSLYFHVGTLVIFNQSLLEFTNTEQTFVVVGTKKNAILIISTVDNSTFETHITETIQIIPFM